MSNKNKIIKKLQRELEVKDRAREAERKRADRAEAKLLSANKSIISAGVNIIFGKIKQLVFCHSRASGNPGLGKRKWIPAFARMTKVAGKIQNFLSFLFNGTKQKKPVPIMLTAILAIAVIMSSYSLINYLRVLASDPPEQQPKNQSFLNLAHKDINPLATLATYTSTSAQDTQAQFEGTNPNIAKGFGYTASTTGNQFIYPSGTSPNLAETSLFFSPRFDLRIKTKMASASLVKDNPANTDLRIYVRGGLG